MKQLKNVDHTFDLMVGETGFTVRKGEKWYKNLKVGEIIELWKCSTQHTGQCSSSTCEYCGQGEIVYSSPEFFKNLSAELLLFQHNKKSRDYHFLFNTMLKSYEKFSYNDVVSLVFYKRLNKGKSCLENLLEGLRSIFGLNRLPVSNQPGK